MLKKKIDTKNLGEDFIEFINKILTSLNIESPIKDDVINEMKELDDNSKYVIINDEKLQENVKTLIEADKKLYSLIKEGGPLFEYTEKIKDEWDKSMKQIARLQGLIILRKISENNCDSIIKSLLDGFNNKLSAVNQILSSDLKAPNKKSSKIQTKSETSKSENNERETNELKDTLIGGTDEYYTKYLKYKNKYLYLKKNNM
jgi:hypothetical protein